MPVRTGVNQCFGAASITFWQAHPAPLPTPRSKRAAATPHGRRPPEPGSLQRLSNSVRGLPREHDPDAVLGLLDPGVADLVVGPALGKEKASAHFGDGRWPERRCRRRPREFPVLRGRLDHRKRAVRAEPSVHLAPTISAAPTP